MNEKETQATPSCGCIFCDLDLVPDDKGYHWYMDWVDGKTMFKCPIFETNSPHPKADQQ